MKEGFSNRMSGCGGMADAQDSKSCVGDYVWVQVPPSAVDEKYRDPLFTRDSGIVFLVNL